MTGERPIGLKILLNTLRVINKIVKFGKVIIWNVLRFIFSPFIRIDEHLMLFGTAFEKFADNPKYLFLHVVKNEKGFNPVWITNDTTVIKELNDVGYKAIKRDSFKAFLYAMRAKYYFFSHFIEDIFYFKRRKTIAINLWHGSPLKKMGFDSVVDLKWLKKRQKLKIKIPYEIWDYLIVAHEKWAPYFESSMKISRNKILPLGLPRNDILWEVKFNHKKFLEIKRNVFDALSIKDVTKKVILYAPTFRDDSVLSRRLIREINKIIKKMEKILDNTEYIFLIRLHPFDAKKVDEIISKSKIIFNTSSYDDLYELLAITDIFISDYSSSIFDFTILGKPIVLYQFDLEEYKKLRGGLYNTLTENCFIIVNNDVKLISILEKIIRTKGSLYNKDCSTYYNVPGSSSERILEFVKKHKPLNK